MKVGLDVRMIQSSGIGTTIRGLLAGFTDEQRRDIVPLGASGDGSISYPIYSLRQHWSYGRFLNEQPIDLYHMPHFDVPLSYTGPLVVTVHDLIHMLFPQYSTKPFSRVYARTMLLNVTRRADRIIAVSENTKKDLISFFPDAKQKTVVLNPAVGPEWRPLPENEWKPVLARYRLTYGYYLYVGNLREGKNVPRLVEAYARFRQSMPDAPPLVLVGKNFLRGFDLASFAPEVTYLGEIPFNDLPALYSAAIAFVFPSLYEGFGLPPLEAMACGTPVLTSRAGSLAEVCGTAACYVEPLSIDSIAEGFSKLKTDGQLRRNLREQGLSWVKRYSWKTFAQGTWKIYEEVVAKRRQPS